MDDTAKRIQEAVFGPIQDEINRQVAPGVQLQVEEALGTIADADPHRLHGLQQVEHVGAAIEGALNEALQAVRDQQFLVDAISRAVLADPRVQAAIKSVQTIAAEVAQAEIRRAREP